MASQGNKQTNKQQQMKKLVIIGGGYGGSSMALALDNAKKNKHYEVTLIDSKTFYECTPITPALMMIHDDREKLRQELAFFQGNHASYLKNVKVIHAKVAEVAPSNEVVLEGGTRVPFDYLVIATGSTYNTFKSEANGIPERVQEIYDVAQRIAKANSILVIGGGSVGVEVAGAIAAKYNANKGNPTKKITLVHSHDRLVQRMPPKVGNKIKKFLEDHGVTVRLNEKATAVTGDASGGSGSGGGTFTTTKGDTISADLVFTCTGITPNSQLMRNHFASHLDERGFIKVTPFLHLEGHPHIFAIGDVNNTVDEKAAFTTKQQVSEVLGYLEALATATATTTTADADAEAAAAAAAAFKKPHKPPALAGLITLGDKYGVFHLPGLITTANNLNGRLKISLMKAMTKPYTTNK